MTLKDKNLKAELTEEGDRAILVLKPIKLYENFPEEWLKISIGVDGITIEMNEENHLSLEEFNSNKVKIEID